MDAMKQLKKRYRASNLSVYMWAKRAGVRVSVAQNFLAGVDVRLSTLEKLAAGLGCRITVETIKNGGVEK